jgi:hypothetical protein
MPPPPQLTLRLLLQEDTPVREDDGDEVEVEDEEVHDDGEDIEEVSDDVCDSEDDVDTQDGDDDNDVMLGEDDGDDTLGPGKVVLAPIARQQCSKLTGGRLACLLRGPPVAKHRSYAGPYAAASSSSLLCRATPQQSQFEDDLGEVSGAAAAATTYLKRRLARLAMQKRPSPVYEGAPLKPDVRVLPWEPRRCV